LGDGLKEYLKYFAFFVVIAIVAFGGIQVLKVSLKTQYPIMVVVSESMVPTLGVGDFILVGQVSDFDDVVAEPQPEGDILVFLKPGTSDEYIVHRAVEKTNNNGEWYFVTKGDNNAVKDSRLVQESNVMGKVIGNIPILGYFPMFIKTSRGLITVVGLMGIVFFADYLMPDKKEERIGGKFPWLTLIPFIIAPMVILLFSAMPDNRMNLELAALAAWYVGCLVSPLAFDDDDMGFMFWLYHFVLTMIPLGCDLVWWMTGITPSRWWYVEGSTVPITFLLQRETPMFVEAFKQFAILLLPGCAVFLLLMMAKRRGFNLLNEISKRIRSAKSSTYI
jgi:signal peptidase